MIGPQPTSPAALGVMAVGMAVFIAALAIARGRGDACASPVTRFVPGTV